MNILVIGSGAREHSICWSLKKSSNCKKIFCIPGNGGISDIADCPNLEIKNKKKILDFCKKNKITFVIIGPEDFLADGLSDYLIRNKIKTFGPSKKASQLETSKSFAKLFLKNNNIPTAEYSYFSSISEAKRFLKKSIFPIVVKANGLASGKGVIICKNLKEANQAIDTIMKEKKFGESGNEIIIEEFLDGFEISYFVFVDKDSFLPLGYALDHKKAFNNDKGPNTGGMGCFTPSKKVNKKLEKKILDKVINKTISGLRKEKIDYRGILFFGLMINKNEPFVIEYNVRFGDPECQTLLRTLESDLLEILLATSSNQLSSIKIKKNYDSVICVVLAANGYPDSYEKNKLIENIEKAEKIEGIEIFHAGTKKLSNKIFSEGGRVLSITSKAKSLDIAREKAYDALRIINWEDGFFREDIGIKNY